MNNIYIPQEIKFGLKSREDTFDGKLSFVIYKDSKNKWAQEKSWNNWRDNQLGEFIYHNKPRSGFIIHRTENRYNDFSGKNTMIRIYHPEGYEFEISPSNLCSIISHSNISHSYIDQECVLGWNKGSLVVIPTNSEIYINANHNTEIKNKSFKDDLKIGSLYITKNQEQLLYIGRHDFFYYTTNFDFNNTHQYAQTSQKKHIAVNLKNNDYVILNKAHIFKESNSTDSISLAQFQKQFLESIYSKSYKPNKNEATHLQKDVFLNQLLGAIFFQTHPQPFSPELIAKNATIRTISSIFTHQFQYFDNQPSLLVNQYHEKENCTYLFSPVITNNYDTEISSKNSLLYMKRAAYHSFISSLSVYYTHVIPSCDITQSEAEIKFNYDYSFNNYYSYPSVLRDIRQYLYDTLCHHLNLNNEKSYLPKFHEHLISDQQLLDFLNYLQVNFIKDIKQKYPEIIDNIYVLDKPQTMAEIKSI